MPGVPRVQLPKEENPGLGKHLVACWKTVVLFFSPLLLSTIIFLFPPEQRKEAECGYVVLLMALFWGLELLPLAITALIPLVAFPVFGIMTCDDVAKTYLPDTGFLFIGGLMMAMAVEKSGLHTRIALFVLSVVGSQPHWILAGFMGVTAFLSMWISNTATASLMVPIVRSVIEELVHNHRSNEMANLMAANDAQQRRRSVEGRRLSIPGDNYLQPLHSEVHKRFSKVELQMAKGMMLSVCYAANIGGSATITGTASNLVLVGQLESLFPHAETGMNFLSWMLYALPQAILCLIICWMVLCLLFLRNAPKGNATVSARLRFKYQRLPPVSFAEVEVTILFFCLLSMFLLREPQFIPGFGSLFQDGFVTDATSAIVITILLFVLPSEVPHCLSDEGGTPQSRDALLDWPTVQEKFSWNIVLLLGGGFALAAGVKVSHSR